MTVTEEEVDERESESLGSSTSSVAARCGNGGRTKGDLTPS